MKNTISIAILDTGVAPVDDLGRRGSRIIAAVDFVNKKTHPYDECGVIKGLIYKLRIKNEECRMKNEKKEPWFFILHSSFIALSRVCCC